MFRCNFKFAWIPRPSGEPNKICNSVCWSSAGIDFEFSLRKMITTTIIFFPKSGILCSVWIIYEKKLNYSSFPCKSTPEHAQNNLLSRSAQLIIAIVMHSLENTISYEFAKQEKEQPHPDIILLESIHTIHFIRQISLSTFLSLPIKKRTP